MGVGALYILFGFVDPPSILARFFTVPRAVLLLPGKHLANPKTMKIVRLLMGIVFLLFGAFLYWKLSTPSIPAF